MTLPSWLVKLAAAAVIPAVIGVGVAVSAPAPRVEQAAIVPDEAFEPGMDGVDYAAVTGPKGSQSVKLPACADPKRNAGLRPCMN